MICASLALRQRLREIRGRAGRRGPSDPRAAASRDAGAERRSR